LPSARQKTLGKDSFTDAFFTEWALPSVTPGKTFAECIWGFAECPRHSEKRLTPVVMLSGRFDLVNNIIYGTS
jgi:hypothetical protein